MWLGQRLANGREIKTSRMCSCDNHWMSALSSFREASRIIFLHSLWISSMLDLLSCSSSTCRKFWQPERESAYFCFCFFLEKIVKKSHIKNFQVPKNHPGWKELGPYKQIDKYELSLCEKVQFTMCFLIAVLQSRIFFFLISSACGDVTKSSQMWS